jgi:hypothetical protein
MATEIFVPAVSVAATEAPSIQTRADGAPRSPVSSTIGKVCDYFTIMLQTTRSASTSVVKAAWFERDWSVDAQPVGRRLAGSSVCDDFEFELLPLVEGAQAGTLDRADVNEHILAAVIRLNEAEALLAVEPLYSARTHENVLSLTVHTWALAREASRAFSRICRFWKNV